MVAVGKRNEGSVRFTYVLPKQKVKGVRYVTNHHYVELEDHKQNKAHLPATGVMRHECGGCGFTWWSSSNRCSFCPSCASTEIQKAWGDMQLAFVPEKESEFVMSEVLETPTDTSDLVEEVIEELETHDDAFSDEGD